MSQQKTVTRRRLLTSAGVIAALSTWVYDASACCFFRRGQRSYQPRSCVCFVGGVAYSPGSFYHSIIFGACRKVICVSNPKQTICEWKTDGAC